MFKNIPKRKEELMILRIIKGRYTDAEENE